MSFWEEYDQRRAVERYETPDYWQLDEAVRTELAQRGFRYHDGNWSPQGDVAERGYSSTVLFTKRFNYEDSSQSGIKFYVALRYSEAAYFHPEYFNPNISYMQPEVIIGSSYQTDFMRGGQELDFAALLTELDRAELAVRERVPAAMIEERRPAQSNISTAFDMRAALAGILPEGYVPFKQAAERLGMETSQACAFIDGYSILYPQAPTCAEGLRIKGIDPYSKEFLFIHRDDVDTFVQRVQQRRLEQPEVYFNDPKAPPNPDPQQALAQLPDRPPAGHVR
ncbi:MAG: hypothetical protein QOE46_1235 [Acidobacteriota bacterium]|jgi:hypothetical protein|nr:hypothetical protein [Acidobacteriota bacterium]